MRYFVTGTDTDVGKTVVSAWLALHLQASYWKPVQCGFTGGRGDRETVGELSGCTTHPERHRFALPRSPHVAAQAAGVRIALADFELPNASRLIVEGAGGVLVPLNEQALMVDLIARLELPVIVVGRGALGGINHLLLSLEALRRRGCRVHGVILTGDLLPETYAAVSDYGDSVVLGHLPVLQKLDRAALLDAPLDLAAYPP